MKIGICGDVHWSAYSSIVRSRGDKYSTRLENLIKSVNWFEKITEEKNCVSNIYLGDFFDRDQLIGEEISALQEIKWNDNSKVFLVGNHEMSRSTLEFSSSHLFKLCPRAVVIDSPQDYYIGDTQLCFLPYILESNRESISSYFNPNKNNKRIIFSHNDIKDIQMGSFISTEGFSKEDIENNCNLFINGHLHNGNWITNKICNLGNLTGQNFSEDANTYKHNIMILDTDTFEIEIIENPYAFNFYKLDFITCNPCIDDEHEICKIFNNLGNNAVITVKINYKNNLFIQDLIANTPNILESRIIINMVKNETPAELPDTVNYTVDHIQQFTDFIKTNLGTSKEILEELNKVLEG